MGEIGRHTGDTSLPYVFISYAHRNSATVFPIIERLAERGVRFWYDGGIEPGKEWASDIERHLVECEVFLLFLSRDSIDSLNCREEFALARETRRNILVCYLEDIRPEELKHGLRLQIPSHQCIFLSRFNDAEGIADAICGAKMILPCIAPVEEQRTESEHSDCTTVGAGKSPAADVATPKLPRTKWFIAEAIAKTATKVIESRKKAYLRTLSPTTPRITTRRTDVGGADKGKTPLRYSEGLLINEMGLLLGIGSCKDRHLVLPDGVRGIANGAFRGCKEIESVVFPLGLSVIPSDAFRGCKNLKSITLSAYTETIGARAFYNCVQLESILYIVDGHIPFEPHVKYIGPKAFMNCKNLRTNTPQTLVTLGEKAYYNCKRAEGTFGMSIREIGRLALGSKTRTYADILCYTGDFQSWQKVAKRGRIMSCRVQYVRCNNGHEGIISEYSTDHIFE